MRKQHTASISHGRRVSYQGARLLVCHWLSVLKELQWTKLRDWGWQSIKASTWNTRSRQNADWGNREGALDIRSCPWSGQIGQYTLDYNVRIVCTIRMLNDNVKLLFINVYMLYKGDDKISAECTCHTRGQWDVCWMYMPYKGDDEMSAEFVHQLNADDNLIKDVLDCYVIVGSDFIVDFSRARLHTA